MINLEVQAQHFKDHVATFKDYGDIKVLDFKRSNSNHYHIRFLFDEVDHRLHISGDLGDLTASRHGGITYESMSNFLGSPCYFEEKVVSHSRPLIEYDEEDARKCVREFLDSEEWEPDITFDFEDREELINEKIDEILEDFDDETGISQNGWDAITAIDPDAWEDIRDWGRRRTKITDLYLLAFSLAKAQIEGREKECISKTHIQVM
jgi:hypothetical protein